MSDYGNDYVVLTDEDGKEQEFEHLDTLEHNGETYMAFIPVLDDPAAMLADSADLVILKAAEDGEGEEILVTVDNETELMEVFEIFMQRLEEADYGEQSGDDEDDDGDDGDDSLTEN